MRPGVVWSAEQSSVGPYGPRVPDYRVVRGNPLLANVSLTGRVGRAGHGVLPESVSAQADLRNSGFDDLCAGLIMSVRRKPWNLAVPLKWVNLIRGAIL